MTRLPLAEVRNRMREATKARSLIRRRKRRESRQRGPAHDELFGGPPIQERPTGSELEHVRNAIAELSARRRAAQPVVAGDRLAELEQRARIDAENARKARQLAPSAKARGERRRLATRFKETAVSTGDDE